MHVGQAAVDPVVPESQAAMIDAQEVKDRGMEVVADRGRKDRLNSVPPPSEPCKRISRTRLSSWWFYPEED
jgi:hypothetical protein